MQSSNFIKIVLTRCLEKYPPQLLWHIALLMNHNHLEAKNSERQKHGRRVMDYLKHHILNKEYRQKGGHSVNSISTLMEQMSNVLASLIKLVPPKQDRASGGSRRSSVKKVKFPQYLSNTQPSNGFFIVVPTQQNLGMFAPHSLPFVLSI